MEFVIPDAPNLRPDRVVACARRTTTIEEEEARLTRRVVLAVQADAHAVLSCKQVKEAVRSRFQLGQHDLEVTMFARATFFIKFADPQLRRAALAERELLAIGRVIIRFVPWSRHTNAVAGSLLYRARVCLEGVPRHAWQPETVKNPFDHSTFIERDDNIKLDDQETACFCVKVWTSDPRVIPKTGTLKIEEQQVQASPEHHFPDLGIEEEAPEKTGPIQVLSYEVLLHLGEILDYSPLPDSPEHQSDDSEISGLPSEGGEVEWPKWYWHKWYLGVIDGQAPQQRRRVPVQERITRPRDRSPPGDYRGGKRGRGNGGPGFGAGLMLGDRSISSKQWHAGTTSGGGGNPGHRRAESCPMATRGGRGNGQKRGPQVCTEHSSWNTLELAFMAGRVVGLGSEPLEREHSQQWDPMLNEVEASQRASVQSTGEQEFESCSSWAGGAEAQQHYGDVDNGLATGRLENDTVKETSQAEHDKESPNNEGPETQQSVINSGDNIAHTIGGTLKQNEKANQLVAEGEELHEWRNPEEIFSAIQEQIEKELHNVASDQVETVPHTTAGEGGTHQEPNQDILPFTRSVTRPIAPPVLPRPTAPKPVRGKAKNKIPTKVNTQETEQTPRRSGRIANRGAGSKPVEQQAIELLMRKMGATPAQQVAEDEPAKKIGERLAEPMTKDTIKDLRDMFGLQQNNDVDFSGLVAEAGRGEGGDED